MSSGALKLARGQRAVGGHSVVFGSGSDLIGSAGVPGFAGRAGLKSRSLGCPPGPIRSERR